MLSIEGWASFISIVLILTIGCSLGIKLIYESIKKQGKLLFSAGLALFLLPLGYLVNFIEYLVIFTTGKNIDNFDILLLLTLLGDSMVGAAMMSLVYTGAKIFLPEKKRYVLFLSLVFVVIYELLLFLDPAGSIIIYPPLAPGEIGHTFGITPGSLVSILIILVFLPSLIIINGGGFLYKCIVSKGLLRKKFFFLFLGIFLYLLCSVFMTTLPQTYTITTIFIAFSFCFLYLGFREESENVKKAKPKKEIKLESEIFRIAQYKREDITEEEVSISKEKKICLVCKGNVGEFNVYVCPGCGTFYCAKCARALIELENMCWVCGRQIDKSKPTKPFEKAEKEEDIEITQEAQKKK